MTNRFELHKTVGGKELTAIAENFFTDDGSARIGDVYFRPVSPADRAKALDDNNPAIVHELDLDLHARYDVFNTDGIEFCSYLNIYYDQGGHMNFAGFRKNKNDNNEVQKIFLTAELIFGIFNFPKTRSGMTKAMMEVAEELHKLNSKSAGWQEIDKDINLQRCKFNM